MGFFNNLSENRKKYLTFTLLAALGFLIYSNTFHGAFIFDDHEMIEENPAITGLSNFSNTSGARYVTNFTFALNYALGGYDTFGYHIVNTLIHVFNAISVYLLVAVTFKTPFMRAGRDAKDAAHGIALVASLFFLIHPVQTQAVAYLSQRYASLATLFYLLSVILYAKSRLEEGETRRFISWAFYAGAFITTVLAQKSKEISFTLPAMLAFYEFTFFGNEKAAGKRLLGLMPFLLCMAIIPAQRFTAAAVSQGGGEAASKVGMMLREEMSVLPRFDYLVTQFRVIVTYLRLLVLPVNQNLDYDYPEFHSLFTPQVFLSFVFLVCVFSSAVYLYVLGRREKNPYAVFMAFGVLWFFITISIESSIIPISDVIFEHRLYLPGAGIIAAASALIFYLMGKRPGLRKIISASLAAIMVLFSAASFKRNFVWADELGLWRDVAEKSPGKARAYSNIGYALVRKDRFSEAIPYFEKVIMLKPDFFGAYNNLGNVLVQRGDYGGSIKYFKRAIELKPDNWKAYNNLGYALAQAGDPQTAVESLEKAVRLRPDYADAYSNLGFALAASGRKDEALAALWRAVKLQPGSADIRNNLANVFLMSGSLDEAVEQYQIALSIDPGHDNARINLSNALRRRDGGNLPGRGK